MKFTGGLFTILFTATIAFFNLSLAQSVTSCAAENILTTCLSNQDIYLKTCVDQDYACLCKWHTAKLSCYDNCPQDVGRASEQGFKDTYCSIASTYNTSTSSIIPSATSTMSMPSNTQSAAAMPSSSSTNSTTTTKSGSDATTHNRVSQQQGIMMWLIAFVVIATSSWVLA